ncbi:MAG: polyphosphate kinase 1 [Kiritimatiellia bacterium]
MKATGKTSLFLNRELSWLEFNQRVLEEALDSDVPLLERVGFLAITASNLDEFFMVRVGGLEILRAEGSRERDPSGLTPAQQLTVVWQRVRRMVADQYLCWNKHLTPRLSEAGIRQVLPGRLTEVQFQYLTTIFRDEIVSVVTPMAVDPEGVSPFVRALRLNVLVRLERKNGETQYAIVPIPACLPRLVALPAERGYEYILIEDVLRLFIRDLFPGIPAAEAVPFRITRNADLELQESDAPDLVARMQEVLAARKRSECLRLEIQQPASAAAVSFLKRMFRVEKEKTIEVQSPLDLSALRTLTELPGFDSLRYEPWPPQLPPVPDPRNSIFEELKLSDMLLCHPYESFEPILRLLQEAAEDPNVLAIKQTLYRVTHNSPVIAALVRAAERGKAVTVFVELKARFDEARNIELARTLEENGVQVVYGVKGLKTHAKVLIVVRREPEGIVRYVHFGTGNYNERTASQYSDVSFMTRDPDLGADAAAFFNTISGYSEPQPFRKLEMAPFHLLERILELTEDEIQRKRQGQDALIMAKMNSLVETEVIRALYRASQAGVRILLNVRGICCLRPGIRGLSENIEVISIVDRFLEHARIFYFLHGGKEQVFISSADWMPRNLLRRVEVMVPVEHPTCRRKLIEVLRTYFEDNVKSRRLLPDGSYQRIHPGKGETPFRSQEILYRRTLKVAEQARRGKRTILEPLRAMG